MGAAGFVVSRTRVQTHVLGFLAVRADRADDEHPDLAAVQQTLVRLRDVYRYLIVTLCDFKNYKQPFIDSQLSTYDNFENYLVYCKFHFLFVNEFYFVTSL